MNRERDTPLFDDNFTCSVGQLMLLRILSVQTIICYVCGYLTLCCISLSSRQG